MQPFNIQTDNVGDYARQVLARRGIDPDTVETREYTIADHLEAATKTKLDMITPALFRIDRPLASAVADWAERYLADPQAAGNLFMRGGVGSGKTTNAFGALRKIALTAARASRRMSFTKVSHADFNQAMRPTPDGAHLDALTEYQTVDLLLFDDLGAGQVTDWSTDTLFRLVDVRWSEQRPMIVTSNLETKELRAAVDERVLSRLADATPVRLSDRDYRRQGTA